MVVTEIKNRDKTMDVARGIAIMVMIMGHTGCGIPFFDFSLWYHAWHMPIFYIVSGYFFSGRNSDIQSFIAKKARQLLVPFAFWLAFDYVYYFFQSYDWEYIKNNLLNACFVWPTGCKGFPVAGALWFLPALFSLEAIYIVMTRLFTNKKIFYIMAVVVGFCGMAAAKCGMYLPFGIDAALVGVPFMAVGELLWTNRSHRFVKELMNMRWYVFLPVFIIVNLLFFYNGSVNFRGTYSNNFLLTYFNAIMGSVLLFNISRFAVGNLGNVPGIRLTLNVCSLTGMNSIIYVCLNQRIISLVQPKFDAILERVPLGGGIVAILTMVTVIFVGYIVMLVFCGSNKMKKFVGK